MENGIERSKSLLREKLLANTSGTGDFESAIAGVRLHRRDELGDLERAAYTNPLPRWSSRASRGR